MFPSKTCTKLDYCFANESGFPTHMCSVIPKNWHKISVIKMEVAAIGKVTMALFS